MTRTSTTRISTLLSLSALLLGAIAGCGSSAGAGNGTMNVHLVDAPADYQEIDLDIREVLIHGPGGWMSLGTPNKVVNLLKLTNGIEETLVQGKSLPAGHYEQMRLLLGPNNRLVLADGTPADLKVPSGQQSGVKFPVSFDVMPDTTADVFIDFDAHRSIFVHKAGNSGKYLLRPVVRAVDRVVTGAIKGKLSDVNTQLPLGGVVVTAQAFDTSGAPVVVRAVPTAADGTYTLDLLPVNGTYYVVAQPVVSSTSYAAQASGGIAITAPAAVQAYSAAFAPAALVGNVSGAILNVAGENDADLVLAEQTLDAGGAPHTFIVRAEPGVVAGNLESYAIASLPAGHYELVATRRTTIDAEGTETVTTSAGVPADVVGGLTTVVDLGF